MSNTPAAKMYTLLPINPNKGWQACRELTGWAAQYAVTGPHTHAVESEYGTIHHGEFDADRARRFAASMGGPKNRAIEVEPYFYCQAWGVVPAASVGPVDVARSGDWQRAIAPGTVLGTGEVVA